MEKEAFKLDESNTVVLRGGYLVPKDDSHISKWQQEVQQLDHCTHLPVVLAEHLKPSQFALDIGAYDGDLTCVMSRLVSDSGMVVAAEAGKLQYECLKHNCGLFKNRNVFPIHTCIGEFNGSTASWEANPSGNLGASICKEIPTGPGLEKRKEGATYLLTTTIDYLVHQAKRKPSLVKLDIEGWECKALIGASETLKKFHPKLIIEINSAALLLQGDTAEDIFTLLGMAGYNWEILQKECTLASPQFDILATPKP